MKRLVKIIISFLAVFVFQSAIVWASENGHYYPGIINIRDLIVPPKGFYYVTYNPTMWSDALMDRDGNKFKGETVSGAITRRIGAGNSSVDMRLEGTLSTRVDVNMEAFTTEHLLMWSTGEKILGADYALLIAPSYGYTRLDLKADVTGTGTITLGSLRHDISTSKHIEFEADKSGFGDLLVEPLWLGWHGKEYDASCGYAFFAPTGAYDPNDPVNIGLGYWTHEAQANFFYYPTASASRSTALMVQGTYGYHTNMDGFDLKPGQTIDLEYGVSQYLSERFEAGVSGYHHWQITDDTGTDAKNPGVHNQVNGLAGQVSVWLVPNKFYVSCRYAWEYAATDRFASNIVTGSAIYLF
ncbi:MAG: transporter [Candidatus Omnitrophota bacterium]